MSPPNNTPIADPPPQQSEQDRHSRFLAAWWGSYIGDALAMPTHWYYKRELIERDYGMISGYLAPKNPHPDSILWRSQYVSTCREDDILHDQAQYWGKPGIHFHQFLKAGENTLNLKLATLLAQSLIEKGGYDHQDYAKRYIDFMLDPDSHRDTYIEEYHRSFFQNYGRNKPIERCGVEDSHIGGIATITPLVLFYHRDKDLMVSKVRQHLQLTHKGETAARAGELFAKTLYYSLKGESLEHVLWQSIGRNHYQVLTYPYRRWISNHSDEEVVGKLVSSAGYLEDALPATYYLAYKYVDNLGEGLIRNTHLGGDNCHRGALLGAILGAQGGCENVPAPWAEGLLEQPKYDTLGDALWAASHSL